MKTYLTLMIVSFLLLANSSVRCQTGMEAQVEHILTYKSMLGERNDSYKKLRDLRSASSVKRVLIGFFSKYKYSATGTRGNKILLGAVTELGNMKDRTAVVPLRSLMFDHRVDKSLRAEAVRSIGKIDTNGNKRFLIKILTDSSDYPPIKLYASEALAKLKDPQTNATLMKFSKDARDPYVRHQSRQAIRRMSKGKL